MNEINKDDTIISKMKEKKTNLIFGYKDKLEIKYRKLHNIKISSEKNQTSKFFNKTSFIKKEKNQTPHIHLNQTNSIFENIKSNNINILDKNKFNSSFGIKKNVNKISSNFFLIKLKESKYFTPMNRNKNQELFHSPSFSNKPKTMRENILMGDNSKSKNSQHFYDISFVKNISDINDNKSQNYINKFLNKSNSQKSFKIRQKFFYNRNNSQKLFFNKSFQNLNKNMKNSISNNKSNSLSSIPIKELNSNISDKNNNEISQLKRMHGIDLRINELLKKNNKDNELKEKDKKLKRQKYLQQLAQFYDNLPSLIMKKNLDKNLIKSNKKVKCEDFGQNFYSPIKIIRKEENQKDEFDKLIQNNPIIKYTFLQKILNSLVHKVNLFGDNNVNLVINSNTITKLNEEIQDFITYGYEYIPENFLKNKNLESPKDLIKDEEFIKIILKTKSSIDNTINNNQKELSQIKAEFDIYTDTGIKINSKYMKKGSNANIMNKFLELQNKKNKMPKKSRFLYKKININKIDNNKMILNKSTNYDHNNKSNDYSLEKSEDNNYINSKTNNNNNINNDNDLLTQLFNILYEDINNLDEIIKKDKLANEKRNIMKHKEKFWRRLLQKNDNNEIIYYVKKKKRRIRSGEKRNNKIREVLNNNYEFDSIENRKIKSAKRYMESKIEYDVEKDNNEDKKAIKLNKNKKDSSTYNIYYKNRIIKDKKRIEKKKQNINLIKKSERVTQMLENIPETNDIFESNDENKKKENSFINKKYYYKRKKRHLKSLKSYNKSREEKEVSKDNNNENSVENKSNISKDKKNDDSYYTNLHLEDILNKKNEENKRKKDEEKKNKENNILKKDEYKRYLLQYQKNIHAKNNEKIISKLLDSENENKKGKGIKKNEESEEKKEEEDKKEDRIIRPRKESTIYFKDMRGKSLEDVEKKKIELLYRFKHDIKYKISTGGISSNEMENFKEFQEKINKLKIRYKDYDINTYIKEMEKIFQSFKDEIENNEKKKIEEDRINKYFRQFQEDYYFKQFYKNLQENILCKVINFSQINHINTLNDSEQNAN